MEFTYHAERCLASVIGLPVNPEAEKIFERSVSEPFIVTPEFVVRGPMEPVVFTSLRTHYENPDFSYIIKYYVVRLREVLWNEYAPDFSENTTLDIFG